MILKLGMKHQEMEVYKIYINHDLYRGIPNFLIFAPKHRFTHILCFEQK